MKTEIKLAEEYASKRTTANTRAASEKADAMRAAYIAGYKAAHPKWISIDDELPHCYQLGFWDGKKSDFVAGKDANGKLHVACLYSGFMDGFEFNDWYDQNDYEVSIVAWCNIPD